MIDQVQSSRLPNGLTILTEHMPGLRSVTVGIWVRRGSRHESTVLNGICHFIEHAVFKGTSRRTALDIAVESDRLGGHLDAYTTHEITGFAMKVADTGLVQAFDLLSDMLARPRFDQEDLLREQKVIIEEMKMVEDTPDEFLGELFNAAYFPDHPLGRPIEGTEETVSSFDREKTAGYHAREYAPRNLVIAAAGNVQHEQLVELAGRAFAEAGPEGGPEATASAGSDEQSVVPATAAPILIERKKELEQAHLIIASPWPHARDEERYAASLLASVIGGGTSSRLWQSIREERGLAYSVGAGATAFTDTGVFNIYAGTSPAHLDQVLDLSLSELRRAVRERVSEEELALVKDQSISSILLGLESSSARAGALARQEIIHGRRITPDEIISRLSAVTVEDLQRVACASFTSEALALAALGDLNGFRVDRARLEI
ncbi:MAG TPA: pitrilysin family protein [Pyrinomonadaceae bacterium]|jgi:predicted Zn-dependent peptidase|nr:pitrilysin family protein [Pyrinomonadaceae bacterium]